MSEELTTAPPKRERLISTDASAASTLLDTAKFDQMARVANLMAMTPMLPQHLRGYKEDGQWKWYTIDEVKATCFLVVNQAIRWNFDPFAVMGETYVVGGKLAWQGKLVAAVVNARAGLKAPLDYRFTGTKGRDDYTCTVSGTFEGEDIPREAELSVGQAKTSNSMWIKDPQQKLVYSAVVRWARRYCPEVVLGVMTDDDLERIRESERDVTPKPESNFEKLARLKAAQAEPSETHSERGGSSPLPSYPEATKDDSGAIGGGNAEVLPPEPPEEEIDEVFQDFLLSIEDMVDEGELTRAREQAADFEPQEKVEAAKAAIKRKATALGLEWSSKARCFIR